ncbi:Serine protease Hip1-like protein [Cladobotryum mycophilum]|uniref:Serine protease Hip1-like protein n=1 Tax=Cladobotryum mycophilum TaxID=491253 RepID=A0ABR0SIK7_9HYPO
MDQFESMNSGGKVFGIPLIRLRGKNATQNLIIKFGGPGNSGIDFTVDRGEVLNSIVGEGFHLVSFDPRGVGSSRPTASCYPDPETRRRLSNIRDKDVERDSPEVFAWTKNFVLACSNTMGEHGKYINTPQTAADMNSILDALGQDSMFEWYESPILYSDFIDTENVFAAFLDECIKAGDACALASLADSKDELQDKVLSFLQSLRQSPANVYINTTIHGILDYDALWLNAVFPILYTPILWPQFAMQLANLMRGNGSSIFLAYGLPDSLEANAESNQFVEFNDGLSGPQHWPQGRMEMLDKMRPYYTTSPFAYQLNRRYYARQQWLIPKTHSFKPRRSVKTARPLLILANTYDPVCPLVSAQSARDSFSHSRIVEVKAYGHCSIAMPSSCLAQHVRNFLYEGMMPSKDIQCEIDGSYF